jgi:pimeloyl-ACP methyl ester carboxylesterase
MKCERLDLTVFANGISLHYRETGPPSGVPVIALHGYPGTAFVWGETAREIGDVDGYRFLALTQRGYGLSDRTGPYSFETFAADVLAFAEALGLGQFVLVGHSMGGAVASLVAAKPSTRLLGLVLVDSVAPRDRVRLTVPARPSSAESLPYDWALVPAIFGRLAAPDPGWWSSLARITVPTLVIAGGSTSHVPQSVLADAAALIPQARLVTLEGAGHSPHRDAPERFRPELAGFLSELTSDA